MRKYSFSFHNSCVLITGASSGLGAEFARQLAPHAHTLVLVARREDRLKKLADELRILNPALTLYLQIIDLCQASEREQLADWIIEEKLPLNFLINNAGLGDLGLFYEATWARLEKMICVNMTALTHLTYLLLPVLRHHKPSALLNVGSVAGFFPLPKNSVYAASKAYVKSFSDALKAEEMRHGVAVSLLCPGPVPTEFFEAASRKGEEIRVSSRLPAPFITSAQKVVSTALHGVLKNKFYIIPNRLLKTVVHFLLILPFAFRPKNGNGSR